jgi:hypothetical protein
MTQLRYKIQAYLGREVSLQDDVEIEKNENGVETINEWITTDKAKPTTEQLDALESEAKSLEDNSIVRGQRREEYGSLIDQIEYITENGLDAWQTKVQEIKTKYPKESE